MLRFKSNSSWNRRAVPKSRHLFKASRTCVAKNAEDETAGALRDRYSHVRQSEAQLQYSDRNAEQISQTLQSDSMNHFSFPGVLANSTPLLMLPSRIGINSSTPFCSTLFNSPISRTSSTPLVPSLTYDNSRQCQPESTLCKGCQKVTKMPMRKSI